MNRPHIQASSTVNYFEDPGASTYFCVSLIDSTLLPMQGKRGSCFLWDTCHLPLKQCIREGKAVIFAFHGLDN